MTSRRLSEEGRLQYLGPKIDLLGRSNVTVVLFRTPAARTGCAF
ncbi:hypothetical protein [Halocatena marina]|uniref:Uncharacterized protein n=1 Tax=Halocatena marina TaxID=2934937 RepID=A0ABD5YUL3_9EURY|nr:hypothetical protein [Halocatena marina]